MSTTTETSVPTKVGQAPLGSYLSYQLAPTEGDFVVSHHIDFFKEPVNTNVSQYPSFPVSQVVQLFSVSESTHDVLEFYTALTLTNVEAASLEKEATGQQQNSKWWTAPKLESLPQGCGGYPQMKMSCH